MHLHSAAVKDNRAPLTGIERLRDLIAALHFVKDYAFITPLDRAESLADLARERLSITEQVTREAKEMVRLLNIVEAETNRLKIGTAEQ